MRRYPSRSLDGVSNRISPQEGELKDNSAGKSPEERKVQNWRGTSGRMRLQSLGLLVGGLMWLCNSPIFARSPSNSKGDNFSTQPVATEVTSAPLPGLPPSLTSVPPAAYSDSAALVQITTPVPSISENMQPNPQDRRDRREPLEEASVMPQQLEQRFGRRNFVVTAGLTDSQFSELLKTPVVVQWDQFAEIWEDDFGETSLADLASQTNKGGSVPGFLLIAWRGERNGQDGQAGQFWANMTRRVFEKRESIFVTHAGLWGQNPQYLCTTSLAPGAGNSCRKGTERDIVAGFVSPHVFLKVLIEEFSGQELEVNEEGVILDRSGNEVGVMRWVEGQEQN